MDRKIVTFYSLDQAAVILKRMRRKKVLSFLRCVIDIADRIAFALLIPAAVAVTVIVIKYM